MIVLEIVQADSTLRGYQKSQVFSAAGGSIGRSDRCDWVLPDPSRMLSSEHAKIHFSDGHYYLVDCSTNGISLKTGEVLQPHQPYRLQERQVFMFGSYQVMVKLIRIEADEFAIQEAGLTHIVNDVDQNADIAPLRQRDPSGGPVSHARDPFAYSNSAEAAVADPFQHLFEPLELAKPAATAKVPEEDHLPDFDPMAMFGAPQFAPAAPKARQFSIHELQEKPVMQPVTPVVEAKPAPTIPKPTASPAPKPAIKPAPAPIVQVNDTVSDTDNFFEFFCRYFELDPRLFDHQDRAALYGLICDTLGALMQGVITLMVSRARTKNQLKLDMTTIQPSQNNPMKFAVNTRQALEMLLRPQGNAFMQPKQAIEMAIGEITRHEEGMFGGLRGGVKGVLGAFSPQVIQQKTSTHQPSWLDRINIFSVMTAWRDYQSHYQSLAQNDAEKLYQQFIASFSETYLKRINQETV